VSDGESLEVLRAAVLELEDRGVAFATDLVRIGAAAMVQRALEAYDARSDVGPGWLAQIVRTGGPWAEACARTESVEDSAAFLARRARRC
jgi:hypothetical protein